MAKETTKKMTLKEFKEAFDEVYDFEIWGYEGILNLLACLEAREEQEYTERGRDLLANASRERHHRLYEILDERGYYNK